MKIISNENNEETRNISIDINELKIGAGGSWRLKRKMA